MSQPSSDRTASSPESRSTARYNTVCLILATSGVLMLCLAFLDWLVHPVALWIMAH